MIALPSFRAEYGRTPDDTTAATGFFSLPAQLRFYIWKLFLDQVRPGTSPIRLARFSLYRDAWTEDDFTSLDSILWALRPWLCVSFDFFAEIMLTLLMTEYFHVVFSPFTTNVFNRPASLWFPKYGRYMRRVILELDMTRFSFGAHVEEPMITDSTSIHSGSHGMDVLISRFVEAQLQRKHPSTNRNDFTMENLFLLCRRFYGIRPATGGIPYCPDSALRICDPLVKLSGLTKSIRICGFSREYADFLMRHLFSLSPGHDFSSDRSFMTQKVSPWPRLKVGSSYIDVKPGKLQFVLDDHTGTVPIAEDEKLPVSAFEDMDANSVAEMLNFQDRAERFAIKARALIEQMKKQKAKTGHELQRAKHSTEQPRLSKDGKAPEADDDESHKNGSISLSNIRRSLSVATTTRSSTQDQDLEKVDTKTSFKSLRKTISSFSLKSKVSKKSLRDGSSDQDSETLIPADTSIPPVPSVPTRFQEDYAKGSKVKDELTEMSQRYGLKVKASKAELHGLLDDERETVHIESTSKDADKKESKASLRKAIFKKFSVTNMRSKASKDDVAAGEKDSSLLNTKPPAPAKRMTDKTTNTTNESDNGVRAAKHGTTPGPAHGLYFPSTQQKIRPLGVQPRENTTPASSLSPVFSRYGQGGRLQDQSRGRSTLSIARRPDVPPRVGSTASSMRQQPSNASMRTMYASSGRPYGTTSGQQSGYRSGTARSAQVGSPFSHNRANTQEQEEETAGQSPLSGLPKPTFSMPPGRARQQYSSIARMQADLRGESNLDTRTQALASQARIVNVQRPRPAMQHGSSSNASDLYQSVTASTQLGSTLPQPQNIVRHQASIQSLRTPRSNTQKTNGGVAAQYTTKVEPRMKPVEEYPLERLRVPKTRSPRKTDSDSPPLPGSYHDAQSFLSNDNPFLSESPKKNDVSLEAKEARQRTLRSQQSHRNMIASSHTGTTTSGQGLQPPGPGGLRLFERPLLANSEPVNAQGPSQSRPTLTTQGSASSTYQQTPRSNAKYPHPFDFGEEGGLF